VRALRAGVLGLGEMGRHHVRVLSELDGVEVVEIADPLGDRFGCAPGVPCCDGLDGLLRQGLDLCVVAVPTAEHAAAALRLAAEGVHTLVEKPLAEELCDARMVAEAFEAAGLVGCVGHVERYNPALRRMQAMLAAGDLGRVYQVATRRQGPFPGRVRDVGVVKDLATHDLDLTAWIARSPFLAVSARTAHTKGRTHEDLAAITGLLGDHTVTNHLVNWISPAKERSVIVTGEHGCLVADMLAPSLWLQRPGCAPTAVAIGCTEPLRTQHEAFRDAIRDGMGDIVSMREGLAAVEVALACIESAAKGVTVDLPERVPA
jgi:UDP-N-acetylglucosamine 3-dehydrogenase